MRTPSPAHLAAIKVGDQLRALGTKSEDGSHYAAEKVVFGTFHNIGATVISVDPQANTLTVKNLATNKPMVVHANADCKMHQLPERLAQMIARLSSGVERRAGPVAGRAGAAGVVRRRWPGWSSCQAVPVAAGAVAECAAAEWAISVRRLKICRL